MKKTIQIIILLILSGNLTSQSFPSLRFRKPTTSDNITWRFRSVQSGTDAYITVIGSKNATVNRIDDSSVYRYAWNPHIRFTSNASSTDTSYVDFRITFTNTNNTTPQTLNNLAMTVVDLDGNGLFSYREMVSTSLPATPKGIIGSTLSSLLGLDRLSMISGVFSFANTDTSNFAAMSQINYENVSTYTMRVGVVGNVTGGTIRQYSFYFKPFTSMLFVLPVKIMDMKVVSNNEVPVLKWTTTSEENANRFEIYRSLDGVNFNHVGTVNATGNSQTISNYSFADNALFGQSVLSAFYKIRIVDNSEEYAWTKIVQFGLPANSDHTDIASVYPNPCKGNLNINFASFSENDFKVEIVDVFGKVYHSLSSTDVNAQFQISLDLNELANGIYFVRISENEVSSKTVKFIKD